MWSTDAPHHDPTQRGHAPTVESAVFRNYERRRNKRIERGKRLKRLAVCALFLAGTVRIGIGFIPDPPPWPNENQRASALDTLVERTLLSNGTTGSLPPSEPSVVRATAVALREFLADFPDSLHAPKFHRHLARALDALSPDYHEAAAREFRPAVQDALNGCDSVGEALLAQMHDTGIDLDAGKAAFGDLDGDGAQDVVFLCRPGVGSPDRVWLVCGRTAAPELHYVTTEPRCRKLELLDVTGDGRPELLIEGDLAGPIRRRRAQVFGWHEGALRQLAATASEGSLTWKQTRNPKTGDPSLVFVTATREPGSQQVRQCFLTFEWNGETMRCRDAGKAPPASLRQALADADAAFSAQDWQHAEALYRQALEQPAFRNDEHYQFLAGGAWYRLATCLGWLGRTTESLDAYDRAVASREDFEAAEAARAMARAVRATEDFPKALAQAGFPLSACAAYQTLQGVPTNPEAMLGALELKYEKLRRVDLTGDGVEDYVCELRWAGRRGVVAFTREQNGWFPHGLALSRPQTGPEPFEDGSPPLDPTRLARGTSVSLRDASDCLGDSRPHVVVTCRAAGKRGGAVGFRWSPGARSFELAPQQEQTAGGVLVAETSTGADAKRSASAKPTGDAVKRMLRHSLDDVEQKLYEEGDLDGAVAMLKYVNDGFRGLPRRQRNEFTALRTEVRYLETVLARKAGQQRRARRLLTKLAASEPTTGFHWLARIWLDGRLDLPGPAVSSGMRVEGPGKHLLAG